MRPNYPVKEQRFLEWIKKNMMAVTILNNYLLNNVASRHTKQKLTDLQRETNKNPPLSFFN